MDTAITPITKHDSTTEQSSAHASDVIINQLAAHAADLASCELCPRRCGVNRLAGEHGVCGADATLRIARAALHEWEEPCISVGAGSGAVFFSYCPLRCVYCQNHDIAQGAHGTDISVKRLTAIFQELAAQGAANINLVTPTHYWPHIAAARDELGEFDLPFICNTSGYERAETIRKYASYIDVYLADFKYDSDARSDAARRYSHAPDYFEVATDALDAMVECAGAPTWDAETGERLTGGVVVRHLLLPGRLEDSKRILAHLWSRYGTSVLYSIMNQYTPIGTHPYAPELDRATTADEYDQLLDYADNLGMQEYFWQEGGAATESFIPPFDNTGV